MHVYQLFTLHTIVTGVLYTGYLIVMFVECCRPVDKHSLEKVQINTGSDFNSLIFTTVIGRPMGLTVKCNNFNKNSQMVGQRLYCLAL